LTESNLIAAPSAATNHPFVKNRLCKRSSVFLPPTNCQMLVAEEAKQRSGSPGCRRRYG
jgi:hypothetical protein